MRFLENIFLMLCFFIGCTYAFGLIFPLGFNPSFIRPLFVHIYFCRIICENAVKVPVF